MDKTSNFLALCLLDALEDENFNFSEILITKHKANPNSIIVGRGIAAIHYACGMENTDIAEKVILLMLNHGGDPNVKSQDNMTPMHVAAIWGRAKIFKLLLNKGGDVSTLDDDHKSPILYAIHECQYEIVKIIQNHLFEKKIERKKCTVLLNANETGNSVESRHLTVLKNIDEKKYTPNKTNYNYDAASPYYINIPHGKNNAMEANDNLFQLTEENLEEYSKDMSPDRSRISFINNWRVKVQKSKNRSSILKKFNDIDELLSGIMDDENLNFTNTAIEPENDVEKECAQKSFINSSFNKLLEQLKNRNNTLSDSNFLTANDESLSQSNFIRSPSDEKYVVQMVEGYVHTDDENGMVFYEKRILTNPVIKKPVNRNDVLETSQTSKSTDFTIPLDYDTEALRAELTNFGDPPGPITKSTKRLYTKRLIKYKRNPSKVAELQNIACAEQNPKFSVELENTLRNKDSFQRIPEFINLENEMCTEFHKHNEQQKRKWREGHLKTSFIYLLIDPRVSENLPGQSMDMEKHDVWKKFLKSIFYVGKGKSSRPYAHLYDAMKIFAQSLNAVQSNENQHFHIKEAVMRKTRVSNRNILRTFNSPSKQLNESKKLDRILDIWKSDMGVICLHVFHNILAAEAYTREAAIIDCIGLQHLTNLKRGDYYGPAQSWTMRNRKRLGIGLLYKAMQVFLAEGESQLMPSDLI